VPQTTTSQTALPQLKERKKKQCAATLRVDYCETRWFRAIKLKRSKSARFGVSRERRREGAAQKRSQWRSFKTAIITTVVTPYTPTMGVRQRVEGVKQFEERGETAERKMMIIGHV
jgi:hypothetical protein